ncbi:MAG: hypothetical protein ACRD5F_13885, partial [Candidatus Acidiferrales bacterium]
MIPVNPKTQRLPEGVLCVNQTIPVSAVTAVIVIAERRKSIRYGITGGQYAVIPEKFGTIVNQPIAVPI